MRVLVLALFVACVGCTSSWTIDSAQLALTAGAEAVQALDREVAPLLEAEVVRADAETTTRQEFLLRLAPWEPVVVAIGMTRRGLLAGQRGIDAWRAGQDGAWRNAAACIAAGLLELERVLPLVGVEVPAEIGHWVELFRGYTLGACTP